MIARMLLAFFVGLIICFLLGKVFDRGRRIDKGFVLSYHDLSYRRRFIRTLWCLPICVIVIVIVHIYYKSWVDTFVFSILSGITFVIQAGYNYYKWKKI